MAARPAARFGAQFRALLRKWGLLRGRAWRLNTAHVAQAAFAVLLVFAIDAALRYSESFYAGGLRDKRRTEPAALGGVPDCAADPFLRAGGGGCLAFAYSPAGDEAVEALVARVRADNAPPIPPDRVRGFGSAADVDAFLAANPQTALAAVHFRRLPADPPDGRRLAYVLQTNSSVKFWRGRFQDPAASVQLPLQRAVERAFAAETALGGANALVRSRAPPSSSAAPQSLAAHLPPSLPAPQPSPPGAAPARWDVSLQAFPSPPLATVSAVGRIAPVFILASLMFNFNLLLASVARCLEPPPPLHACR
jgi:hypothetical protein